jgi:hypothetical protein
VIKSCIKLKKTATETFEMSRSAYGEEQVCLNGIKVQRRVRAVTRQ